MGITGTLINKLVDMKNCEWAFDTSWRISTMKENLKTAKWYTAGLHVATGNHALGPVIINWWTAKQEKDTHEAAAKAQKSYERDTELLVKVTTSSKQASSPLECEQLKNYGYMIQEGRDVAFPTKKDLLIARYEETKDHGEHSLPLPPSCCQRWCQWFWLKR